MQADISGADAAAGAAASPLPAGPVEALAPAIARAAGLSIAGPAARLDALVGQLVAGRPLAGDQLATLRSVNDQFQTLRVQGQQLARLVHEPVQASPEPLALHTAVVDVLLRRGASWRPRVKGLPDRIGRVTVSADPALLTLLLEAAFTWAGELGETLTVKLETAAWPPNGVLTARCAAAAHDTVEDRENQADTLSWQLLLQVAEALQVVVRRRITPTFAEVTLEFTRTQPTAMGLSTLDNQREGAENWRIGGHARGASRAYVALITDDVRAQRHVRAACKRLGLDVQAFARVRDAEEAVQHPAPAVLIIDGLLHDEAFDRLRQRLVDRGHPVRTIEIADTQSGFEVSSWDLESISRIDRDLLELQLASVLDLELGR